MNKSTGEGIEVMELVERGEHLPSYQDIQRTHQIFLDSLDENHSQAVEMLIAAEELKQMAEQLRADRDALAPIQSCIATLLGCALALSTDSAREPLQAVQTHFLNLLSYLEELDVEHKKYAQTVLSMGDYHAQYNI